MLSFVDFFIQMEVTSDYVKLSALDIGHDVKNSPKDYQFWSDIFYFYELLNPDNMFTNKADGPFSTIAN